MCKWVRNVLVLGVAVAFMVGQPVAAGDTTIVWRVMSAGGTSSSNNDYVLKGTVHQTATRYSAGSHMLESGFWPYQWSLGPCCIGIRGNVDGEHEELVDIGDFTYLQAYLFQSGPAPSCRDEGNVNGDILDVIDIGDLTYLINYLFQGSPPPPSCP